MKDRLKDLKELQSNTSECETDIDLEVKLTKKNTFLEDFFTQVDEIRQTLVDLKVKMMNIRQKHSAILSASQPVDRDKEELEQVIVDVQSMMNHAKTDLNKIDNHIKLQESLNRGNHADIRIKKCQHATLSRELVDIMSEYDTIQSNYKENCKNRIKRQLLIVNPNYNEEDTAFQEMIESDDSSIFTQGIITQNWEVKVSLREIESRHKDIITLENSIRQLHQLFIDVAHLVTSQGEMIDRIEYNVQHTAEYVQQAAVHTNKAVHNKAIF